MKLEMLSKEEVEERKYEEKAGMINIYACPACRKIVVYVYADSGTTPISITCDGCGGESFSQIAVTRQPSRYWYRPKSLKELEAIVDEAFEAVKDDYENIEEKGAEIKAIILHNFIEHFNSGGLFSKGIA